MPTTSRTILVSNRLPVTARLDGGQLELTPSSGGLASALRQVHAHAGTHWVGWAGDARLSPADNDRVRVRLADGRMSPVELSASDVARYYDGFSNGVLWPLFHYMTERVPRQITSDWNAYRAVNERFAAEVAGVARSGDEVWVHDFHLMLVPELLRRRRPDLAIGFFLHIPFPSADLFRSLPWREPLLRGVLGADIVGFHTPDYARHFRDSATLLLGAAAVGEALDFEDRKVAVNAYPIGIDAADFATRAQAEGVLELAEKWRQRMHENRIALGVDRLDYTKGIPRRLLGIERFLERWPTWREKIQFVQLAVPTRERTEEYIAFRAEVYELVGRINGRFGTPDWVPIHLLHRSVSPTELSALYRAADLMLVTPLRDGMNLVAKEYCASRVDEDGVLVLSELAGAAAELREALLVNPYDVEATATAIRRGLEMPELERKARMRALRATVAHNDVARWARRLTDDLARVAPTPEAAASSDLGDALRAWRALPRRVLLLDYDGTLVPFAPMPDLAFPDDDLRGLLASLAADPGCRVHVLSGRGRDSLDAWLGDLPLGLHAEHGFWTRAPGELWTSTQTVSDDALVAVEVAMTSAAQRTPGSFVERKGASIAWHFRMADPLVAARQLDGLRKELSYLLPSTLELLDGAKILEVRLRGADKGATARAIVMRAELDDDAGVVAIGDDRTDEDMFQALGSRAITIRVGSGATKARHRVETVEDVRTLLRSIR